MSAAQRRGMVDREHLSLLIASLSIARQCALLGVARSSLYYRPKEASGEDLALLRAMDRQYLDTPCYGSRRMKVWLAREGRCVSRKRVQRLMRIMGLQAIYRSPRTSLPAPAHRVYPYLLRNAKITRPNQAWAADITYLPMARCLASSIVAGLASTSFNRFTSSAWPRCRAASVHANAIRWASPRSSSLRYRLA